MTQAADHQAPADRGACADDQPLEALAAPAHQEVTWVRGKHVVVLNWRDHEHPQAGGAEVYCHAVAEQLVQAGARVTLVTSRAPGQRRHGAQRGVGIVRGGSTLGVYPFVLAWLLRNRGCIDAVLDLQNGIPFFSPAVMLAPTPVICVLHHVHQAQFDLHFPRPVAALGRMLEGPVSRHVYADRPIVAVSPSTREEAHSLLGFRGAIHVVPNGLDVAPCAQRGVRTAAPSIVCVGRMEPQKRLGLLLEAVAEIPAESGLRVELVGSGSDREHLQALAVELGVDDRVVFHGHISAQARDALLDGAWLTVNPSEREGWGLSVLEANARGVPALAYNVPGLRDAVHDGVTGWLVDPADRLAPALMRTLELLTQPDVAERYSVEAIRWAASFSWQRTTDHLGRMLAVEADRLQRTDQPERRAPSNVVARVDRTGQDVALQCPTGGRRTDVWRVGDHAITGLLYGADELDAASMLDRLGIGSARISVARSSDLLAIGQQTDEPVDGASRQAA